LSERHGFSTLKVTLAWFSRWYVIDLPVEERIMTVQAETQETAVAPAHVLTALDRCDSCGAQAYIRATLPSGSELLFCAHHGRKNAEKLVSLGAVWHDESSRLEEPRD
jgi:hypothetical protein